MRVMTGADGEHPAKKQKTASKGELPSAVVLDIEGTVAPISFVTETLFPYARHRLRSHLEATFDSEETQADIQLLRLQVRRGAVHERHRGRERERGERARVCMSESQRAEREREREREGGERERGEGEREREGSAET
jgi:hypothetical protein